METDRVTISIADIKLISSIIDTCSKRGSFKPQEFEVVGRLSMHLALFIKQNSPPEEENSEPLESSEPSESIFSLQVILSI